MNITQTTSSLPAQTIDLSTEKKMKAKRGRSLFEEESNYSGSLSSSVAKKSFDTDSRPSIVKSKGSEDLGEKLRKRVKICIKESSPKKENKENDENTKLKELSSLCLKNINSSS